jgi:alpha-galactosidase
MRQIIDRQVDLGLAAAGYRFFNLDDAWSARARGADGALRASPTAFPSGIPALARYVHARNLSFGIYGDAGATTCLGYPGSRGHEAQDAATWAAWGVDLLKFDNCAAKDDDWVVDRYAAMRDALRDAGRKVVFSLCEWGAQAPWLWARAVGHSWRTTVDIRDAWESVLANLDSSIGLARFAGPGGWNDLDMLEVGNRGLTRGQERAHFALWALLKSPLLVGADLRTLDPASLAILTAREVIAAHQDELGVAGELIWKQGPREVYAAPLKGGARAVVFFNRHLIEYRPTRIAGAPRPSAKCRPARAGAHAAR